MKRRRLHGAAARQLPPGPAARPRARARLPPAGGPAALRRRRRRPRRAADGAGRRALRFEGGRARALLEAGPAAAARRSAAGPGCSVALFARGGLAALDALERAGWDVFSSRPAPTRSDVRPPRGCGSSCGDEGGRRLRRGRPHHPPRGAQLRLGHQRPAAAEARGRRRRSTPSRGASTTSPTIRLCRSRSGGARLDACRAAVEALPEAPADDPVLVALADVVERYRRAAVAPSLDLVRGGLMDVETTRYASWEELREYCRCVAGAVGLACTAVYGPSDPVAAPPRGRDARARAPADQHHARRRRGLAPRARLPPAGRARALRRDGGRPRRRPRRSRTGARSWSTRPAGPTRFSPRASACSRCSTAAARSAFAPSRAIYRGLLDEMRGRRLRRLLGATEPLDGWASCAPWSRSDEGGRRRRRPGRARRRARPRRRGPRGHAARGAADARRRSADAAGARGRPADLRPTTASTSRSAAARSTSASRADRAGGLGAPRAARASRSIAEDGERGADRARARSALLRYRHVSAPRPACDRPRRPRARPARPGRARRRDVRGPPPPARLRRRRRSTASGTCSSARR